jgi:hypothetical protein
VPGTSSEPRHRPARRTTPAVRRPAPGTIRITSIYATPWHLPGAAGNGELPGHLQLWRFEQYYRLSADQLPAVLHQEPVDTSTLRFARWQHATALTGARAWLFALPSGQVVTALSLDMRCALIEVIDLLEDYYFADVHVGETTITEYARAIATQLGVVTTAGDEFLPERHEIVFDESPAADGTDGEDLIQRLIYRADQPYRREYSAIRYPAELNRRPGWLAAVGPYVSVVCGHPEFITNSIFVSAVQAVAAAAQLRAIRQAAHADVRQFRSSEATDGSTAARRRTLERIADQLGDLELELSYSVEATADLGLLVPSLRAESFHNALYESMGLADRAATAGRMLQRLAAAISAELTAIESAERRADDNRRLRYGVAIGFVSAVAVPTGLIFAFLSTSTSQVNRAWSMFSHHYLAMYLAVIAIMVIGGLLGVGLYIQQRRDTRQHRSPTERPRWIPVTDEPPAVRQL